MLCAPLNLTLTKPTSPCQGYLLVEMLEGLLVLFTRHLAWKYFIQWGPRTQDTIFSLTVDMYTKDRLCSCYLNQRLTF